MTIKQKLIELGYQDAEILIRVGKVRVNREVIFVPSTKIGKDDDIEVENKKEFVSRGAYKLLAAIEAFQLNFKDKIVLDVGASTGGFSQVCLLNKAKKVYALDVGTNQLDYNLRKNSKICSMEKTNIKNVTTQNFSEQIETIVCDVSFISLKEVINVAAKLLAPKSDFVALLKPQFEASSKYVEKGGFVNEKYHQFLIDRIINFAQNKFNFIGQIVSPIKGNKSKNTEYILYFQRNYEL
ncbi:TlyA hemolysin [Mesomycoplasma conjunctivae]|uniref:TlyA haemolysin n=1 Tax=Mesomycoplasma conjunctivae (strain ATCC 25834 / NCTC 10147 / HRC/581) TaxID=572263 RepID=C5J683_MESCH|nr:TlyA family RNA methyltransferase [Mesomycoplasma conjunctivae]CAT04975.1 TlyA haemolysin [Mesomycoplasma conjunctivae]VEU66143.1 TlyA hemolysin [Mesomycoplasma conjunctivae]